MECMITSGVTVRSGSGVLVKGGLFVKQSFIPGVIAQHDYDKIILIFTRLDLPK